MSDTNMLVAYFLANTVHQSKLDFSLANIETRAHLVNDIDRVLTEVLNRKFKLLEDMTENEKEGLLAHISLIGNNYHLNLLPENDRTNILLRLWSGCMDATKAIALQTKSGLTSANDRQELFQHIDLISKVDEIYFAGVEAASFLLKLRKQKYTFDGVPSASAVRNYSNEFLEKQDSIS